MKFRTIFAIAILGTTMYVFVNILSYKKTIISTTVLILAYVLIPNHFVLEQAYILDYKQEKVQELLITPQKTSLMPISLNLYDQRYNSTFLYKGIMNHTHYYLEIMLEDSLANPEISRPSQHITMRATVLVPFWKKVLLWLDKHSIQKQFVEQVQKQRQRLSSTSSLYGIDGKVLAVKDTLAYVQSIPIKKSNDNLNSSLKKCLERSLAFAKACKTYPGYFAFYLPKAKNKITYAWITNVNVETANDIKKQKMPRSGYLYSSHTTTCSVDSVSTLIEKLATLISDRGYQQIALPFVKLIKLDDNTKQIEVQIYMPII